MKSQLGKEIEKLDALDEASNMGDILRLLDGILKMEEPLYEQVSMDLGDLVRYGEVIGRIAASNITTSDECDILMTLKMATYLKDPVVHILLGYAMKHGIFLNLAEQKAQAFEGLTWVLAPDQPPTQQSLPNQDPPVEPPDEPPSASSQSPL